MKVLNLFLLLVVSVVILSCNSSTKQDKGNELNSGTHKVEILETIDVSIYTYLRVNEANSEYWMAIPKREIKTGEIYYYDDRVEMQDFVSSELNKKFDKIYFVEDIRETPQGNMHGEMGGMHSMDFSHGGESMEKMHSQHASTKADNNITIEPVEGGITIAELFGNKANYNSKEVIIKGKVVKVNPEIMDRNWVHIQDGTNADGKFDLTVTTQEKVNVNDVVIFKGTITLDKDFGSGYSYDVIMEKAILQ